MLKTHDIDSAPENYMGPGLRLEQLVGTIAVIDLQTGVHLLISNSPEPLGGKHCCQHCDESILNLKRCASR